MSGKPIEVDCRCVIVGDTPQNNGLIVRIVAFFGSAGVVFPDGLQSARSGGSVWQVDRPLLWKNSAHSNIIPFAQERYLRRLDEDWGKTVGWEALKDIWAPEKTEA